MQIIPSWVKVDHNSYNAKLRGIYKTVKDNDITAACEQAKRLYMDLREDLEIRGIEVPEPESASVEPPKSDPRTARAGI